MSSLGLPFSTQVIQATANAPYLGLELGPDADIITDLTQDLRVAGDPAASRFVSMRLGRHVAAVIMSRDAPRATDRCRSPGIMARLVDVAQQIGAGGLPAGGGARLGVRSRLGL